VSSMQMAGKIYKYLNFDQIAEYQEAAEAVKA
jgi:aconitase B